VTQMLTTLLALALIAAQPADKPNFSGEWTLNLAKSNFGALPPPTTLTRTITHAEPALTIEETQTGALGDQSATRKYTTDGSAVTFVVNGATVAGSAKWAGPVLEVLSTVDSLGMTFTDRMSLSADG